MIFQPNSEAQVIKTIQDAYQDNKKLYVIGHGTKHQVGRPVEADQSLSLKALSGITNYTPNEMVIEAYAGTPLEEIEQSLHAKNQELSFEPYRLNILFGSHDTGSIGGAAAMNLSGSRSLKTGTLRDSLIGIKGVNGAGIAFKSGGKVMKNVTGYDLVKLLSGSYGTLAAITHVSFKTQPISPSQTTLIFNIANHSDAVDILCTAMGEAFDITAAAAIPKQDGSWEALLRLEGFDNSLNYRSKKLASLFRKHSEPQQLVAELSKARWKDIQELSPVRTVKGSIWRLSMRPTDAPKFITRLEQGQEKVKLFLDWSGGLIWLGFENENTQNCEKSIQHALRKIKANITLIKAPKSDREKVNVFQPLDPALALMSKKIKASFDPLNLLNSGKLYQDI